MAASFIGRNSFGGKEFMFKLSAAGRMSPWKIFMGGTSLVAKWVMGLYYTISKIIPLIYEAIMLLNDVFSKACAFLIAFCVYPWRLVLPHNMCKFFLWPGSKDQCNKLCLSKRALDSWIPNNSSSWQTAFETEGSFKSVLSIGQAAFPGNEIRDP